MGIRARGIVLLTDDQERDVNYVSITSKKEYWKNMKFGTYRNPPEKVLE